MKVVILPSDSYKETLRNVIKSAADAGERSITLFSTSWIQEILLELLERTQSASRFKSMLGKVFILKESGILIELITVNSYE
jgi:hypothetical protein